MLQFINEFLDWYADVFDGAVHTAWEVMECIGRIVIAIITLPIWIIPFVVWLVFVKRKEGADNV